MKTTSRFQKAMTLRGPGNTLSDRQYQALLQEVRADLAQGKRLNAYFSAPAARDRVKNLFSEKEVAPCSRVDLQSLNPAAADYYRRIAAVEALGEAMKDAGPRKGDDRLRNALLQKASFTYASQVHSDPLDAGRSMGPFAAVLAAREAGHRLDRGADTELAAAVLPDLDKRIPDDFRVKGQPVKWWQRDCRATDNLKTHLAENHEKLTHGLKSWGLEQALVGVEKGVDPEFFSAAVTLSKSAALAASMHAMSSEGSRDRRTAEQLMTSATRQVAKLARIASLHDMEKGASHFDHARELFSHLEQQMIARHPEAAQTFTELSDRFYITYGDYNPEVEVATAAADVQTSIIQPIADKLYRSAADRMKALQASRSEIQEGEIEGGQGQAGSEIDGLKPSPDFMKVETTDDFWRRFEPNAPRPALTPDSIIKMSKAALHEAKKSHDLTASEAGLLQQWEDIERLLNGLPAPRPVPGYTPEDAMAVASTGISRQIAMMRELQFEHEAPAPRMPAMSM